jgi:hypothetical protein
MRIRYRLLSPSNGCRTAASAHEKDAEYPTMLLLYASYDGAINKLNKHTLSEA